MRRWFRAGMGWMLLMCACAPGPWPSPTPALWEGVRPIGEVLADPGAHMGREVWILAYFRGWDVLGEAGGPPPVTGNDVVFADVSGAIYADGRTLERIRGAEKLRPSGIADARRLFRLRARVHRAADGSPYLELLEGEEVKGLPVGVLLREEASGGFAGFMLELLVLEEGKALYIDWKARRRCKTQVEAKEVADLVRALHALPGVVGRPVPGGFRHEVTFREGASFREVTIYTPSQSDEARPIMEILGRWREQGGRC